MSLYVVNALFEKGFSTLLRSVNYCLISADFFFMLIFFFVLNFYVRFHQSLCLWAAEGALAAGPFFSPLGGGQGLQEGEDTRTAL